MKSNPRIPVEIPDDLNEVVLRGVNQGKRAAANRRRIKRTAVRSVCSLILAVGLLAGGISLSPAFAAAVEQIPLLGQLVRIFDRNQSVAEGGVPADGGAVSVTMERDGDLEQMRLDFGQADASLYHAVFASYPKTVTITLPGTTNIAVLSEITRTQDTSQYVKSVYALPTSTPEAAVLQLELENDADVQIEEYRDPGSLVIRLLPTDLQMDTIYSLRTLSFAAQELPAVLQQYAGQEVRVLQDDSGKFFIELVQYSTRESAMAAASHHTDTIVEERTGNNVPVCFATMEQYQSAQFLDTYQRLLHTAFTTAPVLEFVEEYLTSASPEEQVILLEGLHGFIQDSEEELDWARIAALYQAARQDIPEDVQQHLQQ